MLNTFGRLALHACRPCPHADYALGVHTDASWFLAGAPTRGAVLRARAGARLRCGVPKVSFSEPAALGICLNLHGGRHAVLLPDLRHCRVCTQKKSVHALINDHLCFVVVRGGRWNMNHRQRAGRMQHSIDIRYSMFNGARVLHESTPQCASVV